MNTKNHGRGLTCALALSLVASVVHAQTPGLIPEQEKRHTQTLTRSELLSVDRPLQKAEIARALNAVRNAMDGNVFRLRHSPDVPSDWLRNMRFQLRVSAPGGPNYLYWEDHSVITEYSGRPARSCKGAALEAQFVVDFVKTTGPQEWRVSSRQLDDGDTAYDFIQMLVEASAERSDTRRKVGDRTVREFVGPWKDRDRRSLIIRSEMIQSLAVDIDTLLPLRWEIVDQRSEFHDGFIFEADPSISLTRPDGVSVPDCVP